MNTIMEIFSCADETEFPGFNFQKSASKADVPKNCSSLNGSVEYHIKMPVV